MCEETENLELNIRLDNIENQLKELTETIANLQEQLILITDIERYKNLQKFLKEKKFKEADDETTKIILEVSGKDRDNLTPEDVTKFPCNALRVIDNLWQTYSEQNFGFSVQLKAYYDVGGTIDTIRTQDINIIKKFATKVGWFDEKGQTKAESYQDWDFSLTAPKGCFPAQWWKSPYGLKMVTFFFARLIACNL